jgi:glycosyltransferase involved in cell wall biosynthesis
MKKKILFLSPLPPPYYGSSLSSETCLRILEDSGKFIIKNIKLNYSKTISDVGKFNLNKIYGFLKVRAEIKKAIKLFNPDLIYFVPATSSFGFKRDYSFVKMLKKTHSGRIIFHIRSRILDSDWERKPFKKKLSYLFRGEKVIVLGKELVSDIHNMVPRKDLFILPNSIKNEIDNSSFKKMMIERKNIKCLNLLFLSNMDISKGWMKLLQACMLLKDNNIYFKCNFVGAFSTKKEETLFRTFVERNKLNNEVFYLGNKTGNEKNKILRDSNMLIFPTEYPLETFGRVIIEGMMFGLPVIANGIATIPSIINDGKTGFVLKNNSPEEIAKKVVILSKNIKLMEKMGIEGRKRFLENYELKDYSIRFIKIIDSF